MKKLILLFFSLLLSFNSYGEWTRVGLDSEKTIYIDINTIIEKDEFIYWWNMVDSNLDDYSVKLYAQGDCLFPRLKILSRLDYYQAMGLGESYNDTPDNPLWEYYPPDTWEGFLLGNACKLVNSSSTKQEQVLNEIYKSEELQKAIEIEEIEAQAKIEFALELDLRLLDLQILIQEKQQEIDSLDKLRVTELDLRLLDLQILIQEKQQEIDSLDKLRATYQKDELLISLNELRVEIDNARLELEQIDIDKRLKENELLVEIDNARLELEQIDIDKKLKNDAFVVERNQVLEKLTDSIRQSYVNSIAAKVRDNWFFLGAEDGWTAEVNVFQDRNGRVLSVNTSNPSAENSNYELKKAFTDSIQRAVFKSSPLPYVTDDSVFESNINFIFYAN